MRQAELSLHPISVGFLLGSVFDPEDEGNIFLRNVGLSQNDTTLQSRRQCSSYSIIYVVFLLH
jgi:hypothetical protein